MGEEKKALSFVERMRIKAESQKSYGGDFISTEAKIDAHVCPSCGAGRARQDGLTACAYCGHTFMEVKLTDGIHIGKENNSK